jgi:hypothetical protein
MSTHPNCRLALSAAVRLVALRHTFRRRLGVCSIRRGILGVKQHNSISVQQVAAHVLRVVLPYVRLCAERQKPRRRGACGHRVAAFCIVSRWLGHKYTTPGIFLTIPPTQKKLALRGVGSGAPQLRQALRALALPNALRSRRRRFACFVRRQRLASELLNDCANLTKDVVSRKSNK